MTISLFSGYDTRPALASQTECHTSRQIEGWVNSPSLGSFAGRGLSLDFRIRHRQTHWYEIYAVDFAFGYPNQRSGHGSGHTHSQGRARYIRLEHCLRHRSQSKLRVSFCSGLGLYCSVSRPSGEHSPFEDRSMGPEALAVGYWLVEWPVEV